MIYNYDDAFKVSVDYFNGDELPANVFLSKYALRDKDQNLLENSPVQMHRRLAKEFARIESKYPNPLSEEEIFSYLDGFRYLVPQGSPMSGIGNPWQIQSISNCFIVDSPMDSYSGILHADQELVQIMKRRGGVGLDISNIRPKNAPTRNAARTSDGIGIFMERFSNSCREVAQNGRRGAEMQTCSVKHPEISTFINIKRDKKKVTGANVSVRFTDEFMNGVLNDSNHIMKFPVDSDAPSITKTEKAKIIWNEFVNCAWESAEPGALFWDTILKWSPADIYHKFGYRSISTNPCITEDSYITTTKGAKRVKDLIGVPFVALVSGKKYNSTNRGFWHTGKKSTIILETKHGYKIRCTPDHQILTTKVSPLGVKTSEWKMAKDIVIGEKLNLEDHTGQTWEGSGNYEQGYLLGSLIGDGCISGGKGHLSWWGETKEYMYRHIGEMAQNNLVCRSDFATGSTDTINAKKYDRLGFACVPLAELGKEYGLDEKKNIGEEIESASPEFYKGIISGWFDADGTVLVVKEKQRFSVRLLSINLENLRACQRMLARLGIISNIYQNRAKAGNRSLPDGKGGMKDYYCQTAHELVITKNNIVKFRDLIGFEDPNKAEKLELLINSYGSSGAYSERYVSAVKTITDGGEQDVYDCCIPSVSCFDANGITTHNCSELVLSAYDSCRLLCTNPYNFVIDPFTKNAKFDWNKFKRAVIVGQRLMDDMVDLELEQIDKILEKIQSDPEPDHIKRVEIELWKKIRSACENGRRTGLGPTAVGDTVAAMGLRYGSPESIDFVEELYKVQCIESYRCSCILAGERGTFPVFDASLEVGHPFIERVLDQDPELRKLYNKNGRRNIANLTTAPTGSVAIETQTTSGIEPAFLIFYWRFKKINPNDTNARVDRVDAMGDKWQKFPVFHHGFKTWAQINGIDLSNLDPSKINDVNDLDFYKDSPYYKATSNDVDWMASVELQGRAQKWVDHAISKTCNLPKDTTKELVSEVYIKAWQSGCKGFTIYRDGCRDGVLVSNEKKEDSLVKTDAIKRPKSLDCDIHHTKSRGEDFFVLVGKLNGNPYEVFAGRNGKVTHAKVGNLIKNARGHYKLEVNGEVEIENVADLLTDEQAVITRIVSLSLRHGSDIKYVVEQLEKSPGDMTNFGKAVGRVLKKYIKDGTAISGSTCQNCGGNTLVYQEGCKKCSSCGWSACG